MLRKLNSPRGVILLSAVLGLLLSLNAYLVINNRRLRRRQQEAAVLVQKKVETSPTDATLREILVEKNMPVRLSVPGPPLQGSPHPNTRIYDVPVYRSPFPALEQRPPGVVKQLGVLSRDGGNQAQPAVLPLYGARLYQGSQKFRYYTETDKFRPIRLEVSKLETNGNLDKCSDQYGCPEMFDGDRVQVSGYQDPYLVDIYERTLSYNPFV